ncbi:MAG TPA: 16S rRNA (cytosine(1402)-N(4))-methyltransferase RsmH [Gemmatimonadaceae bacterium]|nr:16S rRNA (cytosine(1402)-N(4))-methyltransferase RsmH [Gemmatimonadaceae bacterium]
MISLPPDAYHTPVLAAEVASLLAGAHTVLDGTLGGGGHTQLLLRQGASVVAIDRDPRAISEARARLADFERTGRFRPFLGNFADIDAIDALRGETFDGVLLDLGVSSHQLDDRERGFSFREGAPLDMRMGIDAHQSAAELLNEAPDQQLMHLFREYADERKAPRLAREIVKRRATVPFATSDHLVNAIRGALGPRSGPGDFARIFQAIRIEVNDELGALQRALPALRERLMPGGTMVVIAYHSGEDRVVKHAFRDWSNPCTCPPRQPVCVCGAVALGQNVHRKAITAGEHELAANPRARSARLRAWRRAA